MPPRVSDPNWWRTVGLTLVLAAVLLMVGVVLLIAPAPPVAVVWETASEVGTAGFNIYRAPDTTAPSDLSWRQINRELIPAQGDEIVGARYRYEDYEVQTGGRYLYQIEEVEWDGNTTRFPDIVQARAGLPVVWTRMEGVALVVIALFLLWRKVSPDGTL